MLINLKSPAYVSVLALLCNKTNFTRVIIVLDAR